MGIIKRQSIKQSLVTYLAVAVGTLSYLFVYTLYLSKEQIGFIRFFQDTGMLVVPFVLLGTNYLSVRFFPTFKNEENQHNGFLSFLLFIPLIGYTIFAFCFLLSYNWILEYYRPRFGNFVQYLIFILPLTFFIAYWTLLSSYCLNFKRIVVPAIFNNLFIKLIIPTLILIYASDHIGFDGVVYGILAMHFTVFLALIGYLISLGQWSMKSNRKMFKKPLINKMRVYATYSLIGGLGSIIATRIDTFMVGSLLDLDYTGIFTIALTIGAAIEIPKKAITGIATPIVSQAWKDNDIPQIEELYKKTSLVQFIIGSLLLVCIWSSIDDLFSILPNGEQYAVGKYVVLILGLAKVIDMVTGINNEIISYSKYFRFNFYAILCLAAFNIITNLLLIPTFLINGAALATFSSLLLYNLLKFGFLYFKLKMHPFGMGTLWVLAFALISYGVGFIIPTTGSAFLDIIIRSTAIIMAFSTMILTSRVSPDANELFNQIKRMFLPNKK